MWYVWPQSTMKSIKFTWVSVFLPNEGINKMLTGTRTHKFKDSSHWSYCANCAKTEVTVRDRQQFLVSTIQDDLCMPYFEYTEAFNYFWLWLTHSADEYKWQVITVMSCSRTQCDHTFKMCPPTPLTPSTRSQWPCSEKIKRESSVDGFDKFISF